MASGSKALEEILEELDYRELHEIGAFLGCLSKRQNGHSFNEILQILMDNVTIEQIKPYLRRTHNERIEQRLEYYKKYFKEGVHTLKELQNASEDFSLLLPLPKRAEGLVDIKPPPPSPEVNPEDAEDFVIPPGILEHSHRKSGVKLAHMLMITLGRRPHYDPHQKRRGAQNTRLVEDWRFRTGVLYTTNTYSYYRRANRECGVNAKGPTTGLLDEWRRVV
eukprot:1289857-Amorphochlora_amoeboformis.AAC.1